MDDKYLIVSNEFSDLKFKERVSWGKNVKFGPNCKRVSIGYGCFIGDDVYIDVEELDLGDYVSIHHGTTLHGTKCSIGHNVWIGQYCILDSLGGSLTIGNNVGIGAQSQLWTHMKFGDRLAGCRWYKNSNLTLGDDVWIVGHCIVTAINAEPRSMLLVGSVALEDMKYNHIYAGHPAVNVTDKLGYQFEDISNSAKPAIMIEYLDLYKRKYGKILDFIRVVDTFYDNLREDITYFNMNTREYTPRYTDEEYHLMKFLLYDKAKFIPRVINA